MYKSGINYLCLILFRCSIDITLKTVSLEFANFPPGGGAIPISPAPVEEGFVITLELSPAALGVESISFPFLVTPAGALTFYVNGTAIDPAVGFLFSGWARVVVFGLGTQTTTASDVTMSFGTPIVVGGAGDAASLSTFIQMPSSFGFTAAPGVGGIDTDANAIGSQSTTKPAVSTTVPSVQTQTDTAAAQPGATTKTAASQSSASALAAALAVMMLACAFLML